jgi:hypothetical protein
MKGIVFNLLEEVVRREHGERAWDEVLERSGVGGAYTSLGSYADSDLFRMVAAAAQLLGTTEYEVIRWFGRQALPLLAQKYPVLFERHDGTRSFVLALNDFIHPEVRKLYPGAEVPEFEYDTSSPDVLVMKYRSRRRLCAFAEGLVEGAAVHYGEAVTFEQPHCMLRGDEACTFRISLRPLPGRQPATA